MDLRIKRTQKNIKDAFYELRKHKPIEKISVKELSEAAMINKSTFYLHYRDIYDLSEELERELIGEIMREIGDIDVSGEQSDIELFARSINRAIQSRTQRIRLLFLSSGENNRFIDHLEKSLKQFVILRHPELRGSERADIVLTFMIQGAYYTHIRHSATDKKLLLDTTTEVIMRLISLYRQEK